MTISDVIKNHTEIEIEILLEHTLQRPKEFLYTHPNYKLKPTEIKKILSLITRRLKGEPIAYILGYKYFYGLKFKVNKHTLIPRPETEWLIEKALETANKLNTKNYKPKILDMGTGSGCIAITLGKFLPKCEIHASDVSAKALNIAKQNAIFHKVKIKFILSDLFKKIPDQYDLIIANLPYVPISVYKKSHNNLKHEPKLALTDGTNQNALINKFLSQAQNHLTKNGIILLEVDPTFKSDFKLTLKKDYKNLIRYAIKNPPN